MVGIPDKSVISPVQDGHDRSFVAFPDSHGTFSRQTPYHQPTFAVTRSQVSISAEEVKRMNGSVMASQDVSRYCWPLFHCSEVSTDYLMAEYSNGKYIAAADLRLWAIVTPGASSSFPAQFVVTECHSARV
jgi:hypothetical protein